MSPTIQQNAALAVGRLASHSLPVAELVVRADLLRKLISIEADRPNVGRKLMNKFILPMPPILQQFVHLTKIILFTALSQKSSPHLAEIHRETIPGNGQSCHQFRWDGLCDLSFGRIRLWCEGRGRFRSRIHRPAQLGLSDGSYWRWYV